jgi:hypothetical protein
VYCLEGPDNKDSLVQNIVVSRSAKTESHYMPDLLNGVEVISVKGESGRIKPGTDKVIETEQSVTAIPYYAWANRGPSEMTVWIPYEASAAKPKPAPTIASTSKVTSSAKNAKMNAAINDQYEPADSKDTNFPYLHWWPNTKSVEFVQYDFKEEHNVSESKVYWYDDGPWGGCRIPVSYKVYYKKEGQWIPVDVISPIEIAKDKYNVLTFRPVKTTALKMEVKLPDDNSAGIHEWIVK